MNDLTTQLDERGARKLCAKIKGAIDDATSLILQFYQARGWESLGYTSWTECCREEFGKDHSWASRQIKKLGKIGAQTNRLSYHDDKPIDVKSTSVEEASDEPPFDAVDDTDADDEESEPLAPEVEPPPPEYAAEVNAAWEAIQEEAEAIAQDIGDHVRMAAFVDCVAEEVRANPSLAAVRLENLAVTLRPKE